MHTIYRPGTEIKHWHGVEVWQRQQGEFQNITLIWSWSTTEHQHYEVNNLPTGSYWIPVSTNPPSAWHPVKVQGTVPPGVRPVNPNGTEYRPDQTYIWIPRESTPQLVGTTTNRVDCDCPHNYPPVAIAIHLSLLNKVANFLATMKIKIFGYLKKNPTKMLPGNRPPTG
ncbi:hypothetical protein NIES2109_02040 [Nostoc sp. HK-01]|nr:hypothetical protein NIES2109_02040 [Nostoc sp. HK-01]